MSMLSLTLCFCLAGCHLSLAGWCVFWLAGALLGWLEALPGWLDSLLSWLESLPGRAEIFSGWRMSLFWWLESCLIECFCLLELLVGWRRFLSSWLESFPLVRSFARLDRVLGSETQSVRCQL